MKLDYLTDKIYMEVDADMAEKVKDGKKYWDVKSWTHKYELKDKAELDLENLFEGNEVLGDYTFELPTLFLLNEKAYASRT